MNKKLLLFLYLLPIFPVSLCAMEEEAIASSQDNLIERAAIAYEGICTNLTSTKDKHTNLTGALETIKRCNRIDNNLTPENIANLVTTHIFNTSTQAKDNSFITQLIQNQENNIVVRGYLTNIADYATQKKNKEILETFAETSRNYQSKIGSASRNKWLYWITGGALAGGACYWAYVHGKDVQLPTPFSFSALSNAVSSLLHKVSTSQHIIAGSGIGTALLCGALGVRERIKQTNLAKEFNSQKLGFFPLIQTDKPIEYSSDEDAIEEIIASTNIQALFGTPPTPEKKPDSEKEEEEALKEIERIAKESSSKTIREPIDHNLTEDLEQYLEEEKSIQQQVTADSSIRQYAEEPEEDPSQTVHTNNLIHKLKEPNIWQEECRKLIVQKKHGFIFNLRLDTNPEEPYLTFKITKQENNITLKITADDVQKCSNFTYEQVEDLIKNIERKQQAILENFKPTNIRKKPDDNTDIYETNSSDSSEQASDEEEDGGEETEKKLEKINKELERLITDEISDNIPVWPFSQKQEFTVEIPGNTNLKNKFAITLIPPIGSNKEFGINITHNNRTTRYFVATRESCIEKIYSYIKKIEFDELAEELLKTEFSKNQLPKLIQQFCKGQDTKVTYNVQSHDNKQGMLILEKTQDNLFRRTWIINDRTETESYKTEEQLLTHRNPILNPKFIGHTYSNLNELFKNALMQLVRDFINNNKSHETYTWVDETGKKAILTLNKSNDEIQRTWKIDTDENSLIIMSADDQRILPPQNFVGIRKINV